MPFFNIVSQGLANLLQLRHEQTQLVECRSLVSPISAQSVVVTAAMLSASQRPKTKTPVYSHGAPTMSNDMLRRDNDFIKNSGNKESSNFSPYPS